MEKAQRGGCRAMIAAVTFDSLRKAVGAAVMCYYSSKMIVPRSAFPRPPPLPLPLPPTAHWINRDDGVRLIFSNSIAIRTR